MCFTLGRRTDTYFECAERDTNIYQHCKRPTCDEAAGCCNKLAHTKGSQASRAASLFFHISLYCTVIIIKSILTLYEAVIAPEQVLFKEDRLYIELVGRILLGICVKPVWACFGTVLYSSLCWSAFFKMRRCIIQLHPIKVKD